MEDEFARAVEDGLRLAKRIYTGKERQPPRQADGMDRCSSSPSIVLHPTAPLIYAVIGDPAIVDNPDIPSYQPHVYGRCDPPALIPLQMKGITLEVDCYLDTAFVVVSGRWRLHCVMGSRSCDCRVVVPIGEQDSILGVEVDVDRRSYSTQLIHPQEDDKMLMTSENEDGGLLKLQLFSLTVPQVAGGSDISLKISWSQKLLYRNGHFSVSVPFNFPEYVTPFVKLFSKREKIQLNVHSGTEKEIVCQTTSHTLKEKAHQAGKMAFLYEAEVDNWSRKDFFFSYSVQASEIFGGILTQSPSVDEYDQRDVFCLYLQPGNNQNVKVFKMAVVFLVDISGSMQGIPIDKVKHVVSKTLLELSSRDYFGIIAFNEEVSMFSPSLVAASEDMVENATQWIEKTFSAEGGTNTSQALEKAISLFSDSQDLLSHIFLITDGSVDDERSICHTLKSHASNKGLMSPRVSTFGIGSFANHYFLRMLASICKGQYDAAYYPDSIEDKMGRWLKRCLSPVVANIMVDLFDDLDAFEIYPSHTPDLSVSCPLIVFGRCQRKLPDNLAIKGNLADGSNVLIDLKVQETKDIPLEKLLVKQQIDQLTAQAWFSESQMLEEKVTKLSLQYSVPSEYTLMVLLQTQTEQERTALQPKKTGARRRKSETANDHRCLVQSLRLGFGDVAATAENLPTGMFRDPSPPEAMMAVAKAMGCCGRLCHCCCCPCCIGLCSKLNDQCVLMFAQLCAAFACAGCLECCSELCCNNE